MNRLQLVTDTVADMLEADIDAMYCMISVWEGYRRPLAAVGIHLCTLRKTGTWLMRSETTIAPRPFAYRCAHAKAPGIFLMVSGASTLSRPLFDVSRSPGSLVLRTTNSATSSSSWQTKGPWNTTSTDIWPNASRYTTAMRS